MDGNRRNNPVFILFFFIMFLIGTDTFLISPLLPTLVRAFHVPTAVSGWMVGAYAIGYAVFALFSGPISDRLNKKSAMTGGLVCFAVSTALCGIAPNFPAMIICRLLAGVSASFVTPQVWASIPVLVESKDILKGMGFATAGLSVSQLVGLPVGSCLASFTWHLPFFVISAAAVVLLIIVRSVLPDILPVRKGGGESGHFVFAIYKKLLSSPRAVPYFLAYLIFQTGNFAAFTFIGSWFSRDFGLTVSGVGAAMIALGLGNTLGSLFGSRLTNRLGEPKSLLYSMLSLVVLYTALPFSKNLAVAQVVLFVIFTVDGCLFPVFMSIMQSLSSTARSTVSAVANASMYAGTAVGSAVGGGLFSGFAGFSGISFFTAVMYAISLLIYFSSGIFKDMRRAS